MACGCGCGGRLEDARRAALVAGDPFAFRCLQARGVELGGLLPTIVWPDDARAKKLEVDAAMRTTDAAVRACRGLPDEMRAAWGRFVGTWQAFAAEEVPTFGAANVYDRAVAFGRKLGEWQAEIKPQCGEVPGGAPLPPEGELSESSIGAIKAVAVGVGVLAALGIVVYVGSQIAMVRKAA